MEAKQQTEEKPGTISVGRVRNIGHQVYLANLGLLTKVEEEGRKQIDRFASAGEKARGELAAVTAKPVLVVVGMAELLKEEAGRIFEELVATGEKRRTH